MMLLGAALAGLGTASLAEPGGPDMPRRGFPKPRKRYVKHAVANAHTPPADRARIERAQAKRVRQAERQARGMA